jgi:hypothetical protein
MKEKKFINVLAVCCIFTYLCANCSDTNDSGGGTVYDPSRPVTINSFYPDSGGFATRIIIEGSNFGNNPEEVRVWFNDKQASVIGTNGDHLYAIAPRTPGDECTISVAVGNDSTSIDHPFIYRTATTIVTIAGHPAVTTFKAGTLAEAAIPAPIGLCVDEEGNLYGNSWGGYRTGTTNLIFMLNEEKDIVMQLPGPTYAGGVPAMDPTGKLLLVPTDGGDTYYSYDRDLQWAYRQRQILHPTAEDIAAGKKDFSTIQYKYAFATCEVDGMTYTHDYRTGNLIKFDPVTRKGELVETLRGGCAGRHLFHPVEKEVLYIAYSIGAIYTYNIITGEYKHVAGTLGVTGYRDGPFEDALFGDIGQLLFDENLDIMLADNSSHSIRKLNMKDRMVTTVIGKNGVAGYQDGNPDDAMFNQPYGICIDKNGSIYIADYGNHCIRKLVVQ